MNFNWLHYLDFAQRIKDATEFYSEISEAAYRAAASRAYYGVFKYAVNYAVNKTGFIPKRSGDDHIGIRSHFKEISTTPMDPHRKASVQLERLYDFRRQADYENELKCEAKHLAANAIGIAKLALSHLQTAELSRGG
jgi:uncharacterized protein (UPF0332 family)